MRSSRDELVSGVAINILIREILADDHRKYVVYKSNSCTAPFAAGPLAEVVGRKWALLSSTLFYVVSYILLVTASSVGQMYAARVIQVSVLQ